MFKYSNGTMETCMKGDISRKVVKVFFLMWSPLVRRHLSDQLLWSMIQSLLHTLQIQAGPLLAAIHVLLTKRLS